MYGDRASGSIVLEFVVKYREREASIASKYYAPSPNLPVLLIKVISAFIRVTSAMISGK